MLDTFLSYYVNLQECDHSACSLFMRNAKPSGLQHECQPLLLSAGCGTSMRMIFYMPGRCWAVFPILCCWALGSDAARLGNHSFWQAGQHGRMSQIFGDLARPSAVSSSVPRQLRLRGCPSQMYTAALQVGGQDVAVLVDTGSSSLVLLSNDCIGCDSNAGRYRPGKGATDLRMKDNALYSYYPHIGAVGDVYLDTVSVLSDTIPGITSGASMDVRLALLSTYLVGFGSLQSCSGIRDATGVPGIMGLGLGQGSDNLLLKWGLSSLGTDSLVVALVRQASLLFSCVTMEGICGWEALTGTTLLKAIPQHGSSLLHQSTSNMKECPM